MWNEPNFLGVDFGEGFLVNWNAGGHQSRGQFVIFPLRNESVLVSFPLKRLTLVLLEKNFKTNQFLFKKISEKIFKPFCRAVQSLCFVPAC